MAKGKTLQNKLSVKSRKPTPHPKQAKAALAQFKQQNANNDQILGKRQQRSGTSSPEAIQQRKSISPNGYPRQYKKKKIIVPMSTEQKSQDESLSEESFRSDFSIESKEEEKVPQKVNGKSKYLKNKVEKQIKRPGVPDGTDPNNPVRVYADGVFDMYHIGHAKVLEQAKKLFPHTQLIVGVSGDKETIEKKGKIVMNEQERSEILKHCKWVDEVICPCPWIITIDFLRQHNIHYVAHDEIPYGASGADDIYQEVKKLGMFKATQRTEGVSTSDIILRIIKDYDMYVWRSMKRGYSRKDIGISAFKEQRIKLKEQYKQFKDSLDKEPLGKAFDDNYEKIRNKVSDIIHLMESKSEHLFLDFLKQYTNDEKSLLGKIFGKFKKRELKAKAKELIDEDPTSDFDF